MAKKKNQTATRARPRRSSSRTAAVAPAKFLQFSCNGSCKPSAMEKRVKRADRVILFANGTSVTLNFLPTAPFPFESGVNPINIPADTARVEFVIDAQSNVRRHEYALSCGSCRSGADNPELIVEP